MDENELGRIVIDAAIDIHRELGPGLLESVYEAVLAHKLRARSIAVERQVPISIRYDTLTFEEAFKADLIVAGKVIVEIKCVEKLNGAHRKQLLTYLHLSGVKLGFLLNFSADLMKNGIIRTANGLPE